MGGAITFEVPRLTVAASSAVPAFPVALSPRDVTMQAGCWVWEAGVGGPYLIGAVILRETGAQVSSP